MLKRARMKVWPVCFVVPQMIQPRKMSSQGGCCALSALRAGSHYPASEEEAGDPHEVRTLKHFQVTLDRGLCRRCNTELLGRLEQEVQPILEPMAVRCEPTTLDLDKQRLLAVWAIKTVYLMESAVLRRYPTMRVAEATSQLSPRRAGCLPSLRSGPRDW